MFRSAVTVLLVLGAALAPSMASYGQELVYRFDPELGVPYNVSMTNEVRTQTQFQGMDLDVSMTIGMEQDAVFEAGSEDETVVGRYTFTSISAEMGGMPGLDEMPFDFNDLYQGIVGQTLTIVMSRSGEVVDFTGLVEAMEAMKDELDLPDEMKAVLSEGMGTMFGGGQIKDLVQQGVPFVPQAPLDTGDSWSHSVTVAGMTVDTTYTLGERSDGTALIDVNGDLGGDEEALFELPGVPEIPGVEITYEDLSGEYRGTYELDEATGLAVSYSLDMSMNVDMSMAMPQVEGQSPGVPPMSMSMSVQSTVEGELRRAE
ncbi:MAG: hypothetical protein F4112_01370 [Holophagales bacterium]|nr:hypothetical protein [Holophagales bacterium]MYD22679.1 hypothetical protein [Holophagales bacterium]MYI31598.1 hypothetical protein [Holophagales bacterium]